MSCRSLNNPKEKGAERLTLWCLFGAFLRWCNVLPVIDTLYVQGFRASEVRGDEGFVDFTLRLKPRGGRGREGGGLNECGVDQGAGNRAVNNELEET